MKEKKQKAPSTALFQGLGQCLSKWLFSWLGWMLLGFILNVLLFGIMFYALVQSAYHEGSPAHLLDQVEQSLESENTVAFSSSLQDLLEQRGVWALVLDEIGNREADCLVPLEIPHHFSIGDIAQFSKGFLCDYPVFVRPLDQGLLVLGYPKNSFFKFTTNYYPMQALQRLLWFVPSLFIVDGLLIFGIYILSKRQIFHKSEPIIEAMAHLAKGETCDVRPSGELAPIAQSLNEVSQLLSQQNQARANWIVGVSHDIRTPLSLIIGHAQQIATNPKATPFLKNQAQIIQNDAFQIEHLIQDLNCVSKLEYDMQPLSHQPILLAKLIRSVVAQVINAGLEEQYEIELDIPANTSQLILYGDERLMSRAVFNVLMNAIRHNPKGCHITIGLKQDSNQVVLFVQDDGMGLSQEKLQAFQEQPHYLQSHENRLDLRHGLGLLLVERIVQSHQGLFKLQNLNQPEEKDGVSQGLLVTFTFVSNQTSNNEI